MTNAGHNRREITLTFVSVWLVFCLYSLAAVPTPGVNEPHYLAKARSYQDPQFASADFFLQSGDAHAVFFALTGPFTAVMSFSTVAALGRLISLALLAAGWVSLSRRLSLSPGGTFLSAAIFCGIAMTGNFSGEWVIGGFESKVPAYGLALLGCARWLDASERLSVTSFGLSGVWTGLSIAIHPVVGMWFAIGICLAEIVLATTHRKQPSWRSRWLLGGTVFCAATVICSLPGLIPALKLTLLSGVDGDLQAKANRIQVFGRLAHHLDPASFPLRGWVHTGILMGVTGLAGVVGGKSHSGRRRHNAPDATTEQMKADPLNHFNHLNQGSASAVYRLACLLTMAVVIALGGAALGWHSEPYPRIVDPDFKARWLRYYPFRFVDALLPIACALLVARALDRPLAALQRRVSAGKDTRRFLLVQLTGVLAVSVAVATAAAAIRPAAPSGYTARKYWYWKAACRWIHDNTDSDALFLTPRESFGFKWFAERAEYVCVKDCPQDAAGIVVWEQRLGRQQRWARLSPQDSRFDREDLQRLRQWGITHVITWRLGPFADEPVYQNEVYRIYATKAADKGANTETTPNASHDSNTSNIPTDAPAADERRSRKGS